VLLAFRIEVRASRLEIWRFTPPYRMDVEAVKSGGKIKGPQHQLDAIGFLGERRCANGRAFSVE
jgi:hypothetical protein